MAFLFVLPAWFAAFSFSRRIFSDWREATLAACVTWGVLVVVLTETLSLFHALKFIPLLLTWGVISYASYEICIRESRRKPKFPNLKAKPFERKTFGPTVLLAGSLGILLATLVVALVSPPNNWDSMTYHMARVANWIDHGSARHYPTYDQRQLWLGPFAEFAITHLQILSHGDRFAACVQYVAMLGSLIGASLMAKKLGADLKGQLFAAIFCLSIPMGVLQASSTQNDYVASFWLLCFLVFMIDLVDRSMPATWRLATLAGASIGLATLIKITTLIFAAPFVVWGVVVLCRKRGVKAIPLFGLATLVATSINAGHLLRKLSNVFIPSRSALRNAVAAK
jgi:hypothetical protein